MEVSQHKMAMNKKAAMEMSVGTLVTIVLLMVVLVMGIVLIRNIFGGSTDAVENINNQVTNEINNLFSDSTTKLSISPGDRSITLQIGDVPNGFAFSVRNNEVDEQAFTYNVEAQDVTRCNINREEANGYLLPKIGGFTLPRGAKLDVPELIKFDLPEDAPPCTMTYLLTVKKDGEVYSSAQIFVTIK